MKNRQIGIAILAAFIVGCAGLQPGADPVVVNAERTTQVAMDSFDSFLKYEYENRATLESISPQIHKYANKLRHNGQQWLMTARSMTQAYKYNRNATNKANLETAIAVLQEAVNQVNQYMSQSKSAELQRFPAPVASRSPARPIPVATPPVATVLPGCTHLTERTDMLDIRGREAEFAKMVASFDKQIPLVTTASWRE